MLDFLHELIRAQISALDANTKFVFIQPAYLPQHAILEMFLSEPACLYVRFDDGALAHSTVHDVLQQYLNDQSPNGSWSDVRLLILDECDRVDLAELNVILTEFLSLSDLRVLLLSRLVPDFIRTDVAISSRTRIIPHEVRLMFPDYIADNSKTLLEVRALGGGHVFLNGKPVTDWDGELPRNLFFYLIDRGMATRPQIFEAFWPDLPVHEATNVFHVTKRKINEILGMDLTQYSGSFYRIAPDIELVYDVSLFKDLIQRSAVETKGAAQELLTRAIWLYKGDFLIAIDEQTNPWVQSRRYELSQLYGESLFTQGKLTEQAGDIPAALGLFIRASALNRQREDLAGAIMVLYRKLGMFDDALKTYERIEADILETLGISPAQWLQDLAANIRSEAKTATQSTKVSQ
jgi:DNA-binding SARP family transcriptional activator